MRLTVTCRLANASARDTLYEDVTVEAKDGGDAQRQAIAVLQTYHPACSVSGGPVRPALPDEKVRGPKNKGGRPSKAEQRGVKAHPLDEETADA